MKMLGLEVVYPGEAVISKPSVDIVFVHGIRGHPQKTWTSSIPQVKPPTGESFSQRFSIKKLAKRVEDAVNTNIFWPRDLLPRGIPDARISVYGYDAEVSVLFRKTANSSVFAVAQDLVTRLEMLRGADDTSDVRIIFVAHSLGGIIVKDALKFAEDQHGFQEHLHSIFRCAFGVVFFGTPHRGSDLASLGSTAARIVSLWLAESDYGLLRTLETGSVELQRIADAFSRMLPRSGKGLRIYSFQEGLPLAGIKPFGKVVEDYSSIIGDAFEGKAFIHANHMEMCRFSDANNSDYMLVASVLRRWTREVISQLKRDHLPHGSGNLSRVDGQQGRLETSKSVEEPITLSAVARFPLRLPQIPVRYFTARKREIEEIEDGFESQSSSKSHQRIVVVHGLGGVGKTQVALTYAHKHAHRYSAVFWVDSTSDKSIVQSFRQIAQTLVDWAAEIRGSAINFTRIAYEFGLGQLVSPTTGEVAAHGASSEILVNAVKLWLCKQANKDWLMIFDGADDLDGLDLPSYFPNIANGDILVLSRRSDAAQLGHAVELGCLNTTDSIQMLGKLGRHDSNKDHNEDFAKISQLLGGLPLALAQAGSFISLSNVTPGQYLKIYNSKRTELLSTKPPRSLWQYQYTVLTTWEVSFDAIEEQCPEAATLLMMCGHYYHQGIPFGVFSSRSVETGFRGPAWFVATARPYHKLYLPIRTLQVLGRRSDRNSTDDLTFEKFKDDSLLRDYINLLFKYSLITMNTSSETFSMHAVVHAWCACRPTAKREDLFVHALLFLGAADDVNPHKTQAWPLYLRFYMHATATGKNLYLVKPTPQRKSDTVIRLLASLDSIGWCLSEVQICKQAKEFFDVAYNISKVIFGPHHERSLGMLDRIASKIGDSGALAEAEKLHRECANLSLKYLGKSSNDTWTYMGNWGANLLAQSKEKEASEVLKIVVENKVKQFGIGKAYQAMTNWANALVSLKEHDKAKTILELAERGLMESNPEDIAVLGQIRGFKVYILSDQGRKDEAMAALEDIIATMRQKCGDSHQETLRWRENFLLLCTEIDLDPNHIHQITIEGESLINEWSKLLGPGCEKVSQIQAILGNLLFQYGEIHKGMEISRKALAAYRALLEDDAQTKYALRLGRIHNFLAKAYWDRGLLELALKHYDEALELAKAFEIDNFDGGVSKLDVRNNRAVALRDLRRLSEAEQELTDVIKIRSIEDNADKMGSFWIDQNNLASVYQLQGQYQKASDLYDRTLKAFEQLYGPNYNYALLTMHNMAILQEAIGNDEEAVELLRKTFTVKQTSLGLKSPATLKTALMLGRMYRKCGQRTQAEEVADITREFLDCA